MPDTTPPDPDERQDLVRRADWVGYARRVAKYVHTSRFNSHRLIDDIAVDGQTFTYVANNHPYADHPGLREAEHALFREWAAAQGVRVLAEETYPRAGDDAGYTSVLLLDLDPLDPVGEGLVGRVIHHYNELVESDAAKRRAANPQKC